MGISVHAVFEEVDYVYVSAESRPLDPGFLFPKKRVQHLAYGRGSYLTRPVFAGCHYRPPVQTPCGYALTRAARLPYSRLTWTFTMPCFATARSMAFCISAYGYTAEISSPTSMRPEAMRSSTSGYTWA